MGNSTPLKQCRKCREWKSTSNFYVRANMRDGFTAECKECLKAYGRERTRSHGNNNQRDPRSGRKSEQQVIDHLRSLGIYAVSGKASEYKWADVVAWGCVRIEAKVGYFRNNGYQFGFSYEQINRGIQGDLVLLVWQDIHSRQVSYHLLPANHPVFYKSSGRLKRCVVYLPIRARNYDSTRLTLTEAIMREYRDAWHLIEDISQRISHHLTDEQSIDLPLRRQLQLW